MLYTRCDRCKRTNDTTDEIYTRVVVITTAPDNPAAHATFVSDLCPACLALMRVFLGDATTRLSFVKQ